MSRSVLVGELAVQLAGLEGVAQRLLMAHTPDERGRCRGCTAPGTGLPGAAWPCALHYYASAAAALTRPGTPGGRRIPAVTTPGVIGA